MSEQEQEITCQVNLLDSAEAVEEFYSGCIPLIIESEICEGEKKEWIQRIYSVAHTLLKGARGQLNFFSLSVMKVITCELSPHEKKDWISILEHETLPHVQKEGEKENFYAMCMMRLLSSSLPQSEKSFWADHLDSVSSHHLVREGQRENFYSMACMMIVHSPLSHAEKETLIHDLLTSCKDAGSDQYQRILSYCMVRMAREPDSCSYIPTILKCSHNQADLKTRGEDLIFNVIPGEKACDVLFRLQSSYKRE
ncbi:MAG: hypothetical protein HXS53_00355 [Theionarchaea archaeon]|nr:hypothetical protein [Theionarchaea archaeon]